MKINIKYVPGKYKGVILLANLAGTLRKIKWIRV